jgi:hypothetical protein
MNEEISFNIKRNRKLLNIYISQPDRAIDATSLLPSETYGGLDQEIAEEGGEKAREEGGRRRRVADDCKAARSGDACMAGLCLPVSGDCKLLVVRCRPLPTSYFWQSQQLRRSNSVLTEHTSVLLLM